MRAIIIALFISASLLGTSPAIAATTGPCDGHSSYIRPAMGYAEVTKRVKQLIRCAANHYGISAPKMIAVADCESSFWPWAYSNGNAGVFQHQILFWPSRVRAYWLRKWAPRNYPPSVFNARSNIIVSARMVRASGWGAWSCA